METLVTININAFSSFAIEFYQEKPGLSLI